MKRVYIVVIVAALAVALFNLPGLTNANGAMNQPVPLNGVPVGTILAYAGKVTGQHRDRLWRAGWLPCDGTPLQESQDLPVFKFIDRYWGGNKERHFYRLPDLQGRFVRGVHHDQKKVGDPEAGNRPKIADGGSINNHVGSLQVHAFKDHNHTLTDPSHSHDVHLGAGDKNNEMAADGDHYRPRRPDKHLGTLPSGTGISIASAGGTETRPVNVYVNWIIKIGPPQTGAAPAR